MPCHGESEQRFATQRFPLPFQCKSFLYPSTVGLSRSSLCRVFALLSHFFAMPFYSVPLHNSSQRIPFNALPAYANPKQVISDLFLLKAEHILAVADCALPIIALIFHSIRIFSAPGQCFSSQFSSSATQIFSFPMRLCAFPSLSVLCFAAATLSLAFPERHNAPHFISLPQRIRLPGARRQNCHRSLCRHHQESDT